MNALAPEADVQLNEGENEPPINFEDPEETLEPIDGDLAGGMNSLAPGADSQLNEPEIPVNFQEVEIPVVPLEGELALRGMSSLATGADPQLNELERPTNFADFTPPSGGGGGVGGGDNAEIIATEDLAALCFVTASGKTANSNNTQHFNHVVGILMAAVLTGFPADVIVEGEVSDPSWNWTANQKLWLNGTSLSTSPPTSGFSQLVGITITSQTVFIRLQVPILI